MNIKGFKFNALYAVPLMALTVLVLAYPDTALAVTGKSFGEHADSHWVDELKHLFSLATVVGAFAGFVIAMICLICIAVIKMSQGSPASQRLEQIGTLNFVYGGVTGGALAVLSTVYLWFAGSVAGGGVETKGFDRLNSGLEMPIHQQVADTYMAQRAPVALVAEVRS